MEKTITVEIIDGKYCRDNNKFCRFFWESEDGDYGCCITEESNFLEGDISQLPKLKGCPNPLV